MRRETLRPCLAAGKPENPPGPAPLPGTPSDPAGGAGGREIPLEPPGRATETKERVALRAACILLNNKKKGAGS